jgi:hypothetical protein
LSAAAYNKSSNPRYSPAIHERILLDAKLQEERMSDAKVDGDKGGGDQTGESSLRGQGLNGSERREAPDHTAYEKARNTDTVIRLDDEEDTLYDDALDLEDDSSPLTGINGRDDSTKRP